MKMKELDQLADDWLKKFDLTKWADKKVLDGTLASIQEKFEQDTLRIQTDMGVGALEGIRVSKFELTSPSLNDIFIHQATPVTIPMWQPIVGLIGVVLFTAITVWAGGRIFRSCIIMAGKRPKFGTMIKYIIKG